MKIRNGFVSNSSSSSFCIIGKDRNFEDLDLKDIKRDNIFIYSDAHYGYEGRLGCNLSEELYNFLKKENKQKDFKYIEIYKGINESVSQRIYLETGTYDVVSAEFDNNSEELILKGYYENKKWFCKQ